MAVDRAIWEWPLYEDRVPAWPCPKCGKGGLRIEDETFHTIPDRHSADGHKITDDQATWFGSGRFVCVFRCGSCREICAAAGEYSIDYVTSTDDDYPTPLCRPAIIVPGPHVIKIPEKCPKDVRAEIEAAFLLHWSDYDSCLNRIRNALELLLTRLRIRRLTVNNRGKRVRLALHDRIVALEQNRPKLKELCKKMMAVKHLGNAGSHAGRIVERADVFDGFDILERVLQEMYSTDEGDLAKMVREINKRKGPRKKKGG